MARAKKSGPRHACGKLIQPKDDEREEAVMATALEARARLHGVSVDEARDHLLGTPQGRALKRWRAGDRVTGIDQRQYEAAEVFAKRRRAYLAMVTNNLPSFGSTLDSIIANGRGGNGAEPEGETIARVRSDHREIMDALADAHQGHMLHAMTDAMAMGAEPMDMAAWGYFRPPLNAVANRLKIPVQGG